MATLHGLSVVDRSQKPRKKGRSWCIDDGLPQGLFRDILESHHRLIDGVKFGWGTALVTDVLDAKIAACREFNVDFSFGGTLFEAYFIQGRFEEFLRLVDRCQCPVVEISDGTIDLDRSVRRRIISAISTETRVFSEVGSKDPEQAAQWQPLDWIEQILLDRDAGAELIILETRESGTSGLCLPNGEIRPDVAEGILSSNIRPEWLMFEAPQKAQQAYWIRKLGPEVNLSNIPLGSPVNLETLRLGLRSDTFSLLTQSAPLLLPH
ncbi:MAG: phosphosulfolactate synthase [Firmicutes bacterium]|nr:phosphosulfolactate synthase [Bacillota bacterium]